MTNRVMFRAFGSRMGVASAVVLLGTVLHGCDSACKRGEPRPGTALDPAQSEVPQPSTARPGEWVSLFDGRTLAGWKVLDEVFFEDHGPVSVKDGMLVLGTGQLLTGIAWKGGFPKSNYEVVLDGMRMEGGDFFCGMTFPVGDARCTWINGGWGGTAVGLSNVNGYHAAENETTTGKDFQNGRWYRLRLRVSEPKIEAWIDDEQAIDLERADRTFSVWPEQEAVDPFGVATYATTGALRNIRARRLPP